MQCIKCQQEMPDGDSCPSCQETDRLRGNSSMSSASSLQSQANSMAAEADPPPTNDPPPGLSFTGGTTSQSGSGSGKTPEADSPPSGKEKKSNSKSDKGQSQKAVLTKNSIGNFILSQFNNGNGKSDKKPLADLITPLSGCYTGFQPAVLPDLALHMDIFRSERLLLLSCLDEDLAMTAAHCLIKDEKGEKQQLDFSLAVETGHDENLVLFLRDYENEGKEAVILGDMQNKAALIYLDSLLNSTKSSFSQIKGLLTNKKLRMICIIDQQELERYLRDNHRELALKHWHISFLNPLLQKHYPDCWNQLESRLLRQRGEGKWPSQDSEFYHESKRFICSRELPL
jgi:hypothetical protein